MKKFEKIKTVVFPVAGIGTRFLPATKSVAKELIPILNRPLIEYAVAVSYTHLTLPTNREV